MVVIVSDAKVPFEKNNLQLQEEEKIARRTHQKNRLK